MKALMLFVTALYTVVLVRNESTCIELTILCDSIEMTRTDTRMIVPIWGRNCSKENVFLPNLTGEIMTPIFPEENFCNPDEAAAIAIFVYKKNGVSVLPVRPLIPDSLAYKPMTRASIDKAMDRSSRNFRHNSKLVSRDQSISFAKEVNLKDYHLVPGTYTLQIIYFSGEFVTNYFDPIELAKLQKESKSLIFQGCVKSNQVKLIVR